MEALYSAGEWLAIVLGGLILRFAAAVAMLAALLVVLLPIVYAIEGGRLLLRHVLGIKTLHGFEWRPRPRYTSTHLWLGERARVVRLGLDSLAARLLERAGRIALPRAGSHVNIGDPIATFTAGGRVIVLPAPIEGTVSGVNSGLRGRADLATRHPYGRGWLLEVRPADDGYRSLPRAESARRWFDAEAMKLTLALEHATGRAAADGGVPTVPDHLLVSQDQLGRLAAEFLHASVAASDRSMEDIG